MNPLQPTDIHPDFESKVYTQDYTPNSKIEGVVIKDIRNFVTADGDFSEIIRLNDNGTHQDFPNFQIRQINRSRVMPGSIKAWHLHYNQEDLWYIPPHDHLLVGLADTRQSSPTVGKTMKLVMGGGKSQVLYIPRGVAHGAANVSPNDATIIYFINQQFDINQPDEQRLPWDTFGDDFWTPPKE